MAAARSRNVCTIAPGAPFLPTFAAALLAGRVVPGFPAADDPAALADATIYVPTRRAARALAGELARCAGGRAVILPRIVPLGAMEGVEDALLFDVDAGLDEGAWDESLPEAVSEIDRRLPLTRLILEWGRRLRAIQSVGADGALRVVEDEPMLVATAPAQAFHLAGDLAGLIDEMIIEGVPWERLEKLAPEGLDEYWRITLIFLSIAAQAWPAHLAEIGRIDRAERQARLIARRVAQMGAASGEAAERRVEIVLGSTGTNAATARLIAAIAAAPRGAVVLPGLDRGLDDASWSAIAGEGGEPAAGHPQAALRRLLPTLGVQREAVRELGEPEPALAMRGRFVSEAMRPPETTDRWRAFREETPDDALRGALEGVSLVTAADEREEALALAVALREVLEDPEATAALVTPDRNLARRVRAELARWGVEIDDSGGEPLSGTPHGVLARLTLACAEPGCSAAPLLALLRHPLARLGLDAADLARRVDLAELAVLRGARPDLTDPASAVAAARARLDGAHVHRALRAVPDADWPLMEDLLARLETALAPLRALAADASVDAWVAAHERAVATLAAPAAGEPAPDGEDTLAFAELMADLRAARPAGFGLALRDYVVLFDVMAREKAVRGPRAAHPRIKSLGLLEARLIHADVVLLGGLDEAIWPPAARTDAFLNRPMRAELGLSPPERRIGQTAHDFTQALGAPRVILSRALKRGGAPTTPSRFLLRMETLAGACWSDVRARGARLLDLARRLDAPTSLTRIPRPAPMPDVELRPTSLSVTRIETLRRDPYSVYAERILKLSPLDGLDYEEGAREAGTRMHDMLARFQREFPSGPLPQGAAGRLVEIARETYAADLQDPAFRAFRWPRILTICQHFVGWDAERRESLAELVTEERGELDIPLSDGSVFKLTAVADRIERRPDGAIAVVDFKTGQPPSAAQVETGLAPQLTLEAKMIAAGAFGQLGSGAAIDQALYVKLGGRDSLTERNAVKKGATVQELMDEHYARLVELLEAFRRKDHPYLPRPYAQFVDVHTDYDHLSRYAEWSSGGGDA